LKGLDVGQAAHVGGHNLQALDQPPLGRAKIGRVVVESDPKAAGGSPSCSHGGRNRPIGSALTQCGPVPEQVENPGRHGPLELLTQRGREGDQLLAAGRAARRFQQFDRVARQHAAFSFADAANRVGVIVVAGKRHAVLVRARSVELRQAVLPAELGIAVAAQNGG